MKARHGNLQKYQNPNPLQRYLIARFLDRLMALAQTLPVETVLDAGCAEGFVSQRLQQTLGAQVAFRGVDLDVPALLRGREVSAFLSRSQASVLALPFADAQFDLVLCTEVLEHLPEPVLALREFKRVTRRYVLLSVPHEPWFRTLNFLRGKHVRQWGNDPEHLQNWTGRRFAAFVGQELQVLAVRHALPWSIVLAGKPQ